MIEIYAKPGCPFCDQAKNLLNIKNLSFTEYMLDEDFTRETLLSKFPGVKSFPVIVIDGYNIGGFTQLREHLNQERTTQKLLNEGV